MAKWKKAYVGPFKKEEAKKIVDELRMTNHRNIGVFDGVKMRARPHTNLLKYDIYIK